MQYLASFVYWSLLFSVFGMYHNSISAETIESSEYFLRNSTISGSFVSILAFRTTELSLKSTASLRKQAYTAQNCYRKHCNAKPLQVNAKLESYAQKYAEQISKSGKFEHSHGPHGENLFASTSLKKGCDAIKSWFNEYKGYNFSQNKFQLKGGHFSQLVWKGSKTTGIGVASGKKWTYLVAEYDPPGNSGKYTQNVARPQGNTNDCSC